jgi:peptide/nickel transport system permease protein
MSFFTFLVRRVIHSIFVLLGLSIVIFVISRIMPGDPARMAVGARAPQWVVDNLREQMRLDDPLFLNTKKMWEEKKALALFEGQYFHWLSDALHGDFGISLVTRRQVADDIKEFFPATFELALFAGFINGAGGIFLGTVSAQHKDKWIDNVVRVISYLGVVTPSFVFAVLFLLLFGMTLNWMPTMGRISTELSRPTTVTGLITIDALLTGDFAVFFDALWHLILPGLALAMGGLAQEATFPDPDYLDPGS